MRALLSLFFASFFMLAGTNAGAQLPGLADERYDTLVDAADTHLARQGTYSVGFGGFCGEADHTWEWVIGSGITCENVQGISATGLLAAYELTWDEDYLTAATAAADELVARYDATPGRPYAQDVEFLLWLARLIEDDGVADFYAKKAATYYQRVIDQFPAGDNVQRHFDAGRGSLSGWDIASHIRAAAGVGARKYANDMAAYLIENTADWVGVDCCGGFDVTILSYGSLLWALDALTGKGFPDFADTLVKELLAAQESNGSWENSFQTTAYVLLGLDTQSRRPKTQVAIGGGVAYLITSEVGGGWPDAFGDEYGEVNSEALMALGVTRLDNGMHLGYVDPQPGLGEDAPPIRPEN